MIRETLSRLGRLILSLFKDVPTQLGIGLATGGQEHLFGISPDEIDEALQRLNTQEFVRRSRLNYEESQDDSSNVEDQKEEGSVFEDILDLF